MNTNDKTAYGESDAVENHELETITSKVDVLAQTITGLQQRDKTRLLEIILNSEQKLKERATEEISFVKPIIKYNDYDFFYPNSLNVIQGKMGSHKSRFVGDIASLLLHKDAQAVSGMSRVSINDLPTVCYIDTERNHEDQLPFAIQQIILRSGFILKEAPSRFHCISLIDVSRDNRIRAIREYVEYMRTITKDHLVFIIDVMTDLLGDFNSVAETYTLVDYLNTLINEFEITFFLVIHENPYNDKGRGHTGTEIGNKASSLVQVAIEKNTNIVKITPKKIRNDSANWDYKLKWSDEEMGLVEASGEDLARAKAEKPELETPLSDVLDLTAKVLLDNGSTNKGKLISLVAKEFQKAGKAVSDRTLQRRYEVVPESTTIQYNGDTYKISVKQEGRDKFFSIEPPISFELPF